ncbi:MAG TPA: hypothetical protein VFQ59_02415 [Candidatus Paceibacterota bacterium]|nr:hypothetical protein [Candidatus Paceibacterota bacterium]
MINPKHKKFLFLLSAGILAGGIIAFFFLPKESNAPQTFDWLTSIDQRQKISFDYPPAFDTAYIVPVDWPPQAILMNIPFTCTEAGIETGRAGETKIETIKGTEYCITTVSEGAAGSIYTQYTYTFPKNGKQIVFAFSIRKLQCDNYEEDKKEECKEEQDSFSINTIIDKMASTLQEF